MKKKPIGGCLCALGLMAALSCLGCAGEAGAGGHAKLSEAQKNAIWSLTCCAENSQTSFAYDYAENIGDGRGITFGIIGFTSGTYDGTMLLQRVKEIEPANALAKYLPAFEAIDAEPRGADGLCSDTAGLAGFIDDFKKHGNDPAVKKAQLEKLAALYWEPALRQAREVGLTSALAVGELYDACVNHGEDGNDAGMGLKQLVGKASEAAGGTPRSGTDEAAWLKAFLSIRRAYLERGWPDAVDRVDMYTRILATGNMSLAVPFSASCYGDSFTITGDKP